MRFFLFLFCLLPVATSIARAHDQPPITEYLQFSKTACVAQVTAVTNGAATFTVKEIIRGDPPSILTLRIAEVPVPITLNSEWLLASTDIKEDSVGWALDGDDGWVNAPIKRVDGQVHLVGNYGYVDSALAADSSKGLTLEQLKELAKKPIPKN